MSKWILIFGMAMAAFAQAGTRALFDVSTSERGPFPSDRFAVADRSHKTGPRVNLPLPVIQIAKGDLAGNPRQTAIIGAGGLADRTTMYRHDLAFAEFPTLAKNPHAFMVSSRYRAESATRVSRRLRDGESDELIWDAILGRVDWRGWAA